MKRTKLAAATLMSAVLTSPIAIADEQGAQVEDPRDIARHYFDENWRFNNDGEKRSDTVTVRAVNYLDANWAAGLHSMRALRAPHETAGQPE